jgi:hypothetical protein
MEGYDPFKMQLRRRGIEILEERYLNLSCRTKRKSHEGEAVRERNSERRSMSFTSAYPSEFSRATCAAARESAATVRLKQASSGYDTLIGPTRPAIAKLCGHVLIGELPVT